MNLSSTEVLHIRLLNDEEEIPYELLLLADETVEAINKYIFCSEIYLCTMNRRAIAVYVLKIVGDDNAEVKNIAVANDFQGRGIGSYLLKHASENAAERGFKWLIIGTGDKSQQALKLYQRLGLAKFDIVKDFFIENYPEAIFENGQRLRDMILLKKPI